MEQKKTINIEQIIEEIRQEIREKGYTEDDLSFMPGMSNGGGSESSANMIKLLQASGQLNWYQDLGGGIRGLVKKTLRKLMLFFIVPLVDHQNLINSRMIALLEDHEKQIEELTAQIEGLREQLEERK